MRHAPKTIFIVENNKVLGINLSADYCAEHECGIAKLKEKFGIKTFDPTDGPTGIERRKATKCPSKEYSRWETREFIYEEKDGMAALSIGHSIYQSNKHFKSSELGATTIEETPEKTLFDQLPHELTRFTKNEINFIEGAWDESGFCILVRGDKNIKNLQQLKNEIEKFNIILLLGGGFLLENPGLVIAYATTYPNKDEMKKTDEKNKRLHELAKATGIREKICSLMKSSYGGTPFFALTPFWKKKPQKSKYDVVFWLNPCDQDKNNYGLFTVEELEQWIEGKGPIPMSEKEKND